MQEANGCSHEGTAGPGSSGLPPPPERVGPARPRRVPEPSGPAEEVGAMMTLPFRLRTLGLEMPRNLSQSHIAG